MAEGRHDAPRRTVEVYVEGKGRLCPTCGGAGTIAIERKAVTGPQEAALDSQTRDLLAALAELHVYSRGDLEVLLDE